MDKIKSFWAGLSLAAILFLPAMAWARENPTDWYIKNFATEIRVNHDSTLDITEIIVADCGRLPDKHGIFRILPERLDVEGKKVPTPVELLSITNEKGATWQYRESRNRRDGTVTWQIGNPNLSLLGVNTFVIRYKVANAIRFADPKFDELYWNLNGNFWQLETDRFQAKLIFPKGVTQDRASVELYSGRVGDKENRLAAYRWSAPNILEVEAKGVLAPGEGVTASVALPKNIFMPYELSQRQLYGGYAFFLLPLLTFLLCLGLWWKYGRDPKFDKTVIAQYEVPENLSPLTMGEMMQKGSLKKESVAAEIVNFAVHGFVKISETEKKVLFIKNKDYELAYTGKDTTKLNEAQQRLLAELFGDGEHAIMLSSLKKSFHGSLSLIEKEAFAELSARGFLAPKGKRIGIIFLACGLFTLFVAISLRVMIPDEPFWNLIAAGVILTAFALAMPKSTPKGAELLWRIKGFKLFLETVDKDRAAFYEKENIFEKFLPYAILFGMTRQWIERMKIIYGDDYYARYMPAWYAGSLATFDAGSFASTIDQLSSGIAANTSTASGAGGAGSAGGGGGGGGGGGW